MKAAHVEELADVRCNNPDCTDPECNAILALMPVCHPRGGIYAEYHKADGTLRTMCGQCHQPVITFQIANLPPERKQ